MNDSFEKPDMVVRSIEGTRWGALGKTMSPEERAEAVDALIAKLEARTDKGTRGE